MNWKVAYKNRKRPMRKKLSMAVMGESIYRNLVGKSVDSEHKAQRRVVELERKYEKEDTKKKICFHD